MVETTCWQQRKCELRCIWHRGARRKNALSLIVTTHEIMKIRERHPLHTSSLTHYEDNCNAVFWLNRSGRWWTQRVKWGLKWRDYM
jgi:hypothetical protein